MSPNDEKLVARLTLPCRITGLDVLCTSLELIYGGPLFMRGDGDQLIIFRRTDLAGWPGGDGED